MHILDESDGSILKALREGALYGFRIYIVKVALQAHGLPIRYRHGTQIALRHVTDLTIV